MEDHYYTLSIPTAVYRKLNKRKSINKYFKTEYVGNCMELITDFYKTTSDYTHKAWEDYYKEMVGFTQLELVYEQIKELSEQKETYLKRYVWHRVIGQTWNGFRNEIGIIQELQEEWNGAKVCPSCYEPKHPQLEPLTATADPEALFKPRPNNYHEEGEGEGMSEGYYDPMEDPTFDHDEAERTRGQSGKPAKKKTKKSTKKEEVAYVSQEEVSEESNQESETETLLTFRQFNEGRAEDAKASLEKVKARQKVLDAHEKKTGKKLDITKSPEYKSHKQNFPGAKRTGKKVKGAKETPLETHNRRVNKTVDRIVKKGYTSKEKKEVQSMAKHASRYD